MNSLQIPLPSFRRKLEGLIKNKLHPNHLLFIYYLLRAYRLDVYASISPGTEVMPTDLNLLLLPPGLSRSLLPRTTFSQVTGSAQVSHDGPAFGNELSAVTPFFVQYYQVTWELQMYLIIGTVDMIATKPETMTFPWGVISQAGRGTRELIYDHSWKLHETDYL